VKPPRYLTIRHVEGDQWEVAIKWWAVPFLYLWIALDELRCRLRRARSA
jgi:hypothetical protein